MGEAEKCQIEVWDGWRRRTCGKPIKRDGMCGIHAAAKERRERNEADRKARYAEQRRLDQERQERRQALLAAEAAVERVRALLDGAPMVAQAEVRRALDGPQPAPHQTEPQATTPRGGDDDGQ